MLKKRSFITAVAGMALATLPVFAQEEAGRSEVSVQALGSFVKSTTKDGVPQSATNSGGVLANYRFFFRRATALR